MPRSCRKRSPAATPRSPTSVCSAGKLSQFRRPVRCTASLFIAQPTPKICKSQRAIRTGDEPNRTSSPRLRFDRGAAGPLIAAAWAPHPPTLVDRP
jgi:hypothetical protein